MEKNVKGNTNKVGTERNPVKFAEDDIFGYMFSISKEDAAKMNMPEGIRGLFRTSPFSTTILMGLRKDGWEGIDQNYVSLVEGSSQPYKTQFMNTPLQGVFNLNYARLGVFANVGDRHELGKDIIDKSLDDKTLEEAEKPKYFGLKGNDEVVTKSGIVYKIANNDEVRRNRASELLKSLAILRGGSKQTQFLTDVSPKLLIMAGLTCGNSIFNSLFSDKSFQETRGKDVALNIDIMNEIIKEYSDRIVTPIYRGIRMGYMQNENKIRELENTTINGITFVITTPRGAAEYMSDKILELSQKTTQPEQPQSS